MREDNGSQDVGATAFDLPNSQHPNYQNKIHYGNQHVPTPNNKAAMEAPKGAVMRAILEAK